MSYAESVEDIIGWNFLPIVLLESMLIKFCKECNIENLNFNCSISKDGDFYNVKMLEIKDLECVYEN